MNSSIQTLKNGLKIAVEGFSGENRRRGHERNIFEGCIKVFLLFIFRLHKVHCERAFDVNY